MRFCTDDSGLYYRGVSTNTTDSALAMAAERDVIWNTADAARGMTLIDLKRAGTARRVGQMMAFPSDTDYDGMVRGHMLRDCNIATCNITNKNSIFGPNLHTIQSETVRRSPQPATTHYIDIPRVIYERNRDVDISADVFFINGLPFIVTRSRRLSFITAEAITSRGKSANKITHTSG